MNLNLNQTAVNVMYTVNLNQTAVNVMYTVRQLDVKHVITHHEVAVP
jgi:hypothetical protein